MGQAWRHGRPHRGLRRPRRILRRPVPWQFFLGLQRKRLRPTPARRQAPPRAWTFPVFEEAFNQGYPQELKHFVSCVREDKQPIVTGEDGRAVLEIINARLRLGRPWREGCDAVCGSRCQEAYRADVAVSRSNILFPFIVSFMHRRLPGGQPPEFVPRLVRRL